MDDQDPAPLVDISTLPTSESWKATFRLLEKAGGVKLSRLKELSAAERMKITVNILGCFFGPIYYACKGMWRKGLAILAVCLVPVVLLSLVLELAGLGRFGNALAYGVAAVFGMRANIDYYKKMVLKQNGWW